ncbi:MAG: protein translocase subunit SecD [Actinomycetaceae bacterium]|nr:protein translocase subunit SecD [Arcanobacterium sp.]MDD7686412.1 protein translocase subunit SecD [Actinomycetaceae bacterium]MDY5272692.1 protein translocase subunit SecD [Arcanobacterium sp.]
MATKRTTTRYKAGKRLVILTILVIALLGTLGAGTVLGKGHNRYTPDLALDLEGGTQLILTPITTDGSQITDSDVRQAIEIIRQRVDASGVAEAEITSQGGSNIVVALPGEPSKDTLDLVRTSAVLRLRPVLASMSPNALTAQDVATARASSTQSTDTTQTGATQEGQTTADAQKIAEAAKKLTDKDIQAFALEQADVNKDGKLSDTPATTPENSSDPTWISEQNTYDALLLQCGSDAARLEATKDDSKKPLVACDSSGTAKYILGPADIEGTDLTKATSSLAVNDQGTPTGGWAVNMEFNKAGGDKFAEVTGRIYNLESPRNQFAIVLDGQVLSAPVPSGPISGGRAEITGHFTSEAAASLANQLSFGSLPLNFTVQSEEQISATLGTEQLAAGLIAGLIGLALIVVYMVWQYHSLGLISVASIVLSTGLSYFVICLLSWLMGYRLSMAGVLGMIISVGVTADSFIVYFERIRDEIRDGRTIPAAVDHGWDRAKRTIIISDCVNLIASVVLYVLTVGSVRGFAFTLGITTVLDLVVVMLFTHPLMVELMKTRYFGHGRKFSGLEESQLQRTPLYRGRGNAFGAAAHTDMHGSERKAAAGTAELSHVEAAAADTGENSADSAAAQVAVLERLENETLAQRKARLRREAKEAAAGGVSDAQNTAAETDADASAQTHDTASAGDTPTDGDATSEGRA